MLSAGVPSLIVVALMCPVLGSEADPFVGRWTLDEDRSKIDSGLRLKIERRGAALRFESAGMEYTALLDGDDYPIRGISSNATVSLRRLNERSIQRTYKREGKPVSGAEMNVSADGKFLVVRIKRLDISGSVPQWEDSYLRSSASDGNKDPFEGTWERNPIRSLGNSLSTVVFEALEGGGLHFFGNQTEYSAWPDGQNHKVAGTIAADSITLDRAGLRKVRELWKRDGSVVATVVRVVAEDGVHMTATVTGITPQGNQFENVYAYRRN
jgi:hypothetical protein